MLTMVDRDSEWIWEIPGQDNVPPERRIRAICRARTVRQWLRYRDTRKRALTEPGMADDVVIATLIQAAAEIIIRLENVPEDVTPAAEGLIDLATVSELMSWTADLGQAAQSGGVLAGKSVSPLHGGGGESASGVGTVAGV